MKRVLCRQAGLLAETALAGHGSVGGKSRCPSVRLRHRHSPQKRHQRAFWAVRIRSRPATPCYPEIRRRGSSCLTVIEVEKPAEARSAGNLAICPVVIRRTDVPDQFATDALVKPLGHVVVDEFLDQVAQMSLAEDDELIETLVLDGLHEALRVRIAIGALRWDFHALHAPNFENGDECLREQRVTV